jgi:cyclopropane-fatty-acyl-phospholipid synthase
MNQTINQAMSLRGPARESGATRNLLSLLDGLAGGLLEIRLPSGATHVFGNGERSTTLQVHDEAMFERVLARGDLGLAEAYLDGQWDSPDVASLLTLLAGNRDALTRAVYGSWRQLLAARLRHWFNRNSRAGSRRNIMAHYDLGNDFYRLWLDSGMSYSSAIFRAHDDGSLLAGQDAKYRRILDRLQPTAGDSVLEIGCGWGGFAEAALRDGLKPTGLTLSPAQLDWARRRVPEADLRLQDYRDLAGRFDHVVSIEMFEAVGEAWWPTYFDTLRRSLKSGGKAMVQTITIRDDLFARYRRGTDFIQQYIFPGGMLPSRHAFRRQAARAGLAVTDEFAFGQDYARTLGQWRMAFEANWPQIAALGFDDVFRRLWRFYLAYSEAGFAAGNIDVVQFELVAD